MQNYNIRLTANTKYNTLKKLIVCTKSGSMSYISDAYGGAASDRFITEDCGVVSKFNRGMVALVDRGFNVQDLFLKEHVTVAMPPQFYKGQKTVYKIASRKGKNNFKGTHSH